MRKPSIWFWIIGGLFLLWNAFGCYMYMVDVAASDARYAEVYGEAMLAVRDVYPSWAMAAYATAVWGGLLAAALLLLRRNFSIPLFMISLVAAVIRFIPSFVSAPLREVSGATFWVMPVIIVVIGIVQVWFSLRARAKGTFK